MKKLIYDGIEYDNIYCLKGDNLLKLSVLPREVWESFCDKNLKFVNNPIEYREITSEDIGKYNINVGVFVPRLSAITLPFLNGYKTLGETVFEDTFTTKEILQLLKKNMNILKYIHQNGVSHGDIHSDNIMINEKYDIEFIDFEAGTFDEYISAENTFYDDYISNQKKIQKTIHQDKIDLLISYFSYLAFGNFRDTVEFLTVSLKSNNSLQQFLNLDKYHSQYLYDFINEEDGTKDYYYIDFIDDLISEDYQSPVIYSKNMHNKSSK